jgi:hypothetical protein
VARLIARWRHKGDKEMKTGRKNSLIVALGLVMGAAVGSAVRAETQEPALAFSPPAVPLVACDPYFSIWSPGDRLAATDTEHWTGKPHRLVSLARIDGETCRVLGGTPAYMPALEQVSLRVLPTRTIYVLAGGGIELTIEFMTPALPHDIDLLSRPLTYVTYELRSTDGREHQVELLFAAAGELAVNVDRQRVSATIETWPLPKGGDIAALRVGSVEQAVLETAGDDLRIDWGYFYLAATDDQRQSQAIGSLTELALQFVETGQVTGSKPVESQAARETAVATTLAPATVDAEPTRRWLVLAYDDLYSIEYMHAKLRPYWRRNGLEADGLLIEAARDYTALRSRCAAFDDELMNDLRATGGDKYAQIAALAYRQCFAAGKFVADKHGQPIQFCKENNSNGCIATSDVFYPMAPQFLMFGPSLAKSFVVPFMEYAASDRWKFDFAPHDLGTYPKANGQVYGGGERSEENQMPVEECGNLLILMGAIAQMEGHADFAARYWPQLKGWAEYLKQQGYDPDRQLCTDDFAGHLAHNVNLSAKAIVGLGCFAKLCELRGDTQLAQQYRAIAQQYAERWIAEADDGNHFRLAFDKPGTWSQKYNLVWDRVLGLELFPQHVLEKEMRHYRQVQNQYGLPLDNRREYTKLDWILWTATLTGNPDDFAALVDPVHKFLDETPDKVAMTDWYETKSGRQVGFKARPVVGGVMMPVLHRADLWNKWADRDTAPTGEYASMPRPPKVTMQLPAADSDAAEWRYTTRRPSGDWRAADYDDSSWRTGKSGFGTRETPGAAVGTLWNSRDIWIRRTFDFGGHVPENVMLHIHHDEDAEVYINGLLARRLAGFTTQYVQRSMAPEALAALKPTGNVIAVHCRQTSGGQYIDVGLATVEWDDDTPVPSKTADRAN